MKSISSKASDKFQVKAVTETKNLEKTQKKQGASDYLEWSQVIYLIDQLKKDRDYSMYSLVCVAAYCGLRFSDVVSLRWEDIINKQEISVCEKKTKKIRSIKINPNLCEKLEFAYKIVGEPKEFIVANKTGKPLSIQYVNRRLKIFKLKYNLPINNFSSHSLRKAFARKIWEIQGRSDYGLLILSDILQHQSIKTTKIYLSIQKSEIDSLYLSL